MDRLAALLRRLPKATDNVVELALAMGVGVGAAGVVGLYVRHTIEEQTAK